MGRLRTTRAAAAAVLLLAGGAGAAAGAEGVSLQARASVFRPTDAIFRQVYGSGPTFGGELVVELSPRFAAWAGGDYYSRRGTLTFTGEETRLRMVPLSAGLRVQFGLAGLEAYLGGGLGYFRYRETTPFSSVESGRLGFVGRAGLLVGLGPAAFLDFQAAWSACRVRPLGIEAELGGLRVGVGAGFRL